MGSGKVGVQVPATLCSVAGSGTGRGTSTCHPFVQLRVVVQVGVQVHRGTETHVSATPLFRYGQWYG